jgi:hypothetical protein
LRAAEAVLTGSEYCLTDVTGASLGGGWITRLVDWGFTRGAGRGLRTALAQPTT